MTDERTKSTLVGGSKYPKESFTGKLTGIYTMYNENLGAYVLELMFEDEKTYNIPLTVMSEKSPDGMFGLHRDGTVDEFLSIGQFLKSIEKINLDTGLPAEGGKHPECFWVWTEFVPEGWPKLSQWGDRVPVFETEPELKGKILHNKATPRKIGDEQQSSKYPDWTITQIEGFQKSEKKVPGKPPASAKKEEKPQEKAPETDGLEDFLIKALEKGPKKLSDLWKESGKKYQISQLRDSGLIIEDPAKKEYYKLA